MSPRRTAQDDIDELGDLISAATANRGGVAAAAVNVPAVPQQDASPEVARRQRLHQLEATIEQSVTSFRRAQARHYREVGPALEEIRDHELYLEEGYTSWLDYLDRRWEYSESHAYRFIDMGKVCAALAPLGDKALEALTAESHARELLPALKEHGDDAVRRIWAKVTGDASQKVTAERIAKVRDGMGLGRRAELQRGTSPIGEVVDAELVDAQDLAEGRQAVAFLDQALTGQKRLYDNLSGDLIQKALTADPGRAEYLLAELRRYANRTAYRIGKKAGKVPGDGDEEQS